MPKDELKCIKYLGKTYCWDQEKRVVEVYTKTIQPLKKCPEKVIQGIIKIIQEETRRNENGTNS
jgi:hypothetical protein